MKKVIIVSLMFLFATTVAFAQRGNDISSFDCPKLYVGTSLGIDNPAGAWGFNIEVPFARHLSIGTGAGFGTWGAKTFGEFRYYFSECHRGWALGSGIAYSTGFKNLTVDMPTTTVANADVKMDLNPRSSLFIAAYRFWNMGRRGHRVNVMLGYAMQMGNGSNYTIKNGYQLQSSTERVINTMAPGGIMIGCGFSFGVIR